MKYLLNLKCRRFLHQIEIFYLFRIIDQFYVFILKLKLNWISRFIRKQTIKQNVKIKRWNNIWDVTYYINKIIEYNNYQLSNMFIIITSIISSKWVLLRLCLMKLHVETIVFVNWKKTIKKFLRRICESKKLRKWKIFYRTFTES